MTRQGRYAVVMMSMFVALLQKVDETRDEMSSQFAGVFVLVNCSLVVVIGAETCGLFYLTVRDARRVVVHSTRNKRTGQG